MKFRRQTNQEVSVNLTPLIDVVFLLLIFFMVSTTFTQKTELEIDLPEADGKEAEQPADHVEVEINAEGQYSVNDQRLDSSDRDALLERIRQVAGDDTSIPFVITADAKTSHELVVRAMDVAGTLGFSALSISTQRTPSNDNE
ncbi:biopolymer transport protein ExbD [Halospina denitrificans]|uniref:Biopolymer transport protein ExbD n=1 Tax=Halospina denitrificans TaxID=332522 RepID=A0A4V3EPV5_9GAMM|nr:biopolymer transporter ExbD [Halospina denitrificans]TDT39448.1 biopolymer transport protein ExbD [Halospina denitrificans]